MPKGKIKENNMSKRNKLKEAHEKIKKNNHSFWSDFKKFITKGNVLDMAVAVVIATAFNAIVNGLVKNIITPFVTYFTSGVSIDEWEYVLREAADATETTAAVTKISIQYGLWLQSIVDFLIIAFSVFVAVRIIKGMEKRLNYREEKAKAEAEAKAAEEARIAEEKAKAEAEAKAAVIAAEAEAKAKTEADFYKNIKEQSKLLRDIKKLLSEK